MRDPRTIAGPHKVERDGLWHLSECLMVEHPEHDRCTCHDDHPDADS